MVQQFELDRFINICNLNIKDPFTKKPLIRSDESDFAIGGRKAVKPKLVLPSSNPMDVRISASKGQKRVFI